MKTFSQYLNSQIEELATLDVDQDNSGNASLSEKSQTSFNAAMQAFEIILTKHSDAGISFLNRMTEAVPEIKTILQKYGLDNFTDGDFRNAPRRSNRLISKGLADVSTDDVKNGDVVAAPSSDSFHNPIG